jgi:ferrous iron transport protein A
MALPTESLVTESFRPTLVCDDSVPLSSLAPGSHARITDVDATTPEGHRLLELGFLPETEIRVVRRAPLRDPIAFYLRGGQICLRRSEAALIRVISTDAEPAA